MTFIYRYHHYEAPKERHHPTLDAAIEDAAGAYPIEAALLEPRPGVTSGRHSVPLPDAGAVRGTIR